MSGMRLSPSWYTIRNQVAYTVGVTPDVYVEELVEKPYGYELPIILKDCKRAKAIRTILPERYELGNITIEVKVYVSIACCDKLIVPFEPVEYESVMELAKVWCEALNGNPLFLGLFLTEGKLPPMAISTVGEIVVVIDKSVVQFYNDDLSDLCRNYNEVASKVFAQICENIFIPDYKVTFTTYDKNCINLSDLVCRCCK